jgi:SagB-type dehydrogenase family enzyme
MQAVHQELITLPAPRLKGSMSVETALAVRRSRRAYSGNPLTLAEAAQLLWAAQGITGPEGRRTAPSAGALFPLEVYLSATRIEGLAAGIYKYIPADHSLALHAAGDRRRSLTAAASDQDCMRFSACAFLFAAAYERTTVKYGSHGRQYVCMEAAHALANAQLQATALGLSTCPVGAFDPAAVRLAAELPDSEEPVYLLTAGKPA